MFKLFFGMKESWQILYNLFPYASEHNPCPFPQGRLNYQQYIRGCAIHHTYNRAVTIHGTHEAVLEDNVAYKTMGHT